VRDMSCYVYVKLHTRGSVSVLAICDEDLLGKSFREGMLKLEVKRDFYGERKVPIDEALRMIEEAEIVNMVGRNVIGEAIRRGLIPSEGVITIAGVPHVQIIKL